MSCGSGLFGLFAPLFLFVLGGGAGGHCKNTQGRFFLRKVTHQVGFPLLHLLAAVVGLVHVGGHPKHLVCPRRLPGQDKPKKEELSISCNCVLHSWCFPQVWSTFLYSCGAQQSRVLTSNLASYAGESWLAAARRCLALLIRATFLFNPSKTLLPWTALEAAPAFVNVSRMQRQKAFDIWSPVYRSCLYQQLMPWPKKNMDIQSFQSLCTGRERDLFCAKNKISYFLAASQARHVKQSRRQKSIFHTTLLKSFCASFFQISVYSKFLRLHFSRQ